jgi:hypothetical protein
MKHCWYNWVVVIKENLWEGWMLIVVDVQVAAALNPHCWMHAGYCKEHVFVAVEISEGVGRVIVDLLLVLHEIEEKGSASRAG